MPDVESAVGDAAFASVPWIPDSAASHGVAIEQKPIMGGEYRWGEGHPVETGRGVQLERDHEESSVALAFGNFVAVVLVIAFSLFIATWVYANADGLSDKIFGLVR